MRNKMEKKGDFKKNTVYLSLFSRLQPLFIVLEHIEIVVSALLFKEGSMVALFDYTAAREVDDIVGVLYG